MDNKEKKISLEEFETFSDTRGDRKGRRSQMSIIKEQVGIKIPIKVDNLENILIKNGYRSFNINYIYKIEKDNGYTHKIKKDGTGVRWICFYKRKE